MMCLAGLRNKTLNGTYSEEEKVLLSGHSFRVTGCTKNLYCRTTKTADNWGGCPEIGKRNRGYGGIGAKLL